MKRLDGRVVATTRDGQAADPLVAGLERVGATVLVWPTMAFEGPADGAPLERALADLSTWDWVVVTSARGVYAVADRLEAPPDRPAVAAVGAATAEAARSRGWSVDTVGDGHGAAGVVEALARSRQLAGARVLFPAASGAAGTLEEGLARAGARVHRVEAYRTVATPPDAVRVHADLARGVDAVTFASPSAVASLAAALDHDLGAALQGSPCVAIGPTTSAALRRAGVADPVVAADSSLVALVEACASLFPAS